MNKKPTKTKKATKATDTEAAAVAAAKFTINPPFSTVQSFVVTVKSTVGEKKNYNLVNYTQYHVATIEATATPKGYRARIGFKGPEGHVFFNSDHQDFADAERMVNFVKEGKSSGRLYNIFAQTLEIHPSPGPPPVTVVEVLGLIYSYILP